MRKIIIISLLVVVLGMALNLSHYNKVDGASTKVLSISDDFCSSTINDDLWDTTGETAIVPQGGAIQIKKGDYSTSVGWKGLRDAVDKNGNGNGLSSDYSLEVTISCVDTSWFAVYLGSAKAAQRFSSINEGNPASVLVFAPSSITHYVGQGKKATDYPAVVEAGSEEAKADASRYNSVYPISKLSFDGTRYCLKFEAYFGTDNGEDRSKNYIDVYCVKEPTGREKDTEINYGEKIARLYYAHVNGYFSFGSTNTGVATFSNIKVTDLNTGTKLYEPKGDLLTPTVEHVVGSGKEIYKDFEFRVWNTTSNQYSEMIKNGQVGYLKLENNSELLTKIDIKPDKKLYSIYDVDLRLKIKDLGTKKEPVDIILGTDDTTEGIIKIKKLAGSRVVFSDTKGKEVEYTLGSDAHLLSFQVKSDKKVEIYIDKNLIGVFELDTIGGKTGLRTRDGQLIDLTLFNVNTYKAESSSAPSVAIDFTLKDEVDGKPYVDSSELYILGNARRLKGYDEIAFINAKRGSFIATRHPYSEYVVKFDLYDITQNDPANIMTFSFGKDTYNEDYDTCNTLIFVSRGYSAPPGDWRPSSAQ